MTDQHNEVTISIAAQLSPLHRPDGEAFMGDLAVFADSMCAYVAQNLERFADQRGGDTFVAITVTRGEESAGREFRSGRYVRPDPEGAVEPDPGAGGSGATA